MKIPTSVLERIIKSLPDPYNYPNNEIKVPIMKENLTAFESRDYSKKVKFDELVFVRDLVPGSGVEWSLKI